MTPAEILRAARDPEFWRKLAPSLRIGEVALETWPARLEAARERLRAVGFAKVERAVPAELVAALADGLRCLHDANIPTPALYLFDEPWTLASGLAPTFEALLGAPPRVLRDVWAWLVPAEAGASGWAPHRGVTYDVRDETGAPTLLNVWIALSDVDEASACMHVVPLPDDPHYPAALERVDFDEARAVALPAPAGTLLAWNANVLHFGGAMKPGGRTRLSLSYTIATQNGLSPREPPSFEERVDLLADMLVTYASPSGASGPWLEWARLWSGMREASTRKAT